MRSYTLSTNKQIVIAQFGGFHLSEKAKTFIATVKNYELNANSLETAAQFAKENRDSDALVLCLKLLGSMDSSANGCFLKIAEVPYDVEWYIEELNGKETIVEKHRTWD